MSNEHLMGAAKAMAELYVWDAIISILEGGASPQIGCKSADKIIRMAKREQQNCLRHYDQCAAKLSKQPAPDSEGE